MERVPIMEQAGQRNGLSSSLKELDRLLRGDATRPSALRRGNIEVSPDGLMVVILVLGLLYGVCMGCYALFQTRGPSLLQFAATTGKVPVLFLLTLIVTFPSLYVFNALVGSRLTLRSVLHLIVATLAVMLAILASFGPIVAFFSVSTANYPFMLLLNVVVFAVSGCLGLKFLLLTLHRLSLVQNEPPASGVPVADVPGQLAKSEPSGALDRMEDDVPGRDVITVFSIWIIVFGLVGAQMSWVLRPFLGHPDKPFMLFAARESNFFEAVFRVLAQLIS
jgi:hypothetical protein